MSDNNHATVKKKRKSLQENKSILPGEICFHVAMKLRKPDRSAVLYKDDMDRFRFKESIKLRSKSNYYIVLEIDPTPPVPLR